MKLRHRMIALAGLALVMNAPATRAHVALEKRTVDAESWSKVTFKVPEGCGGAATTAIRVDLPQAFYLPRAMPNGTWKVEVVRERLAKPIESHGAKITEAIRSVIWSGKELPDDFYDEFSVFARMPSEPGKYPINVTQTCTTGEIKWHDVAKPGQSRRELRHPAPELDVTPKPTRPAIATKP
jgi:periplasmic copper chaperone A